MRTERVVQIIEQSRVQGSLVARKRRLGLHSRRFVDGEQILVPVEDVRRGENERLEREAVEVDLNLLPGLHRLGAAANTPATDVHPPKLDNPAHGRPRQFTGADGDKLVETNPDLSRGGNEVEYFALHGHRLWTCFEIPGHLNTIARPCPASSRPGGVGRIAPAMATDILLAAD